jgi:hypothetical protein
LLALFGSGAAAFPAFAFFFFSLLSSLSAFISFSLSIIPRRTGSSLNSSTQQIIM